MLTVAAVRSALQPLATSEQKAQAEAYFKGALPFLGVKGPLLDACFKAHAGALAAMTPAARFAFALACFDEEPAELRHVGVLTLSREVKRLPSDWLVRVRPLVERRAANWGTADAFAGRVMRFRLPNESDRAELLTWARAESPWLRRVACVAFVNEARKGLYASELAAPGVVTVRGAPGSGKSALAAEAAATLRSRGWRVVQASLGGCREPLAAATAVLRAAGVQAPGGELGAALDAAAAVLREPHVLALLDNADSPAAIEVIAGLAALGECTVLAVGAAALGLPAEAVVPLGPMPLAEAVGLLRERVQRAGGELSEAEAGALVERASGLPLVLELLAPQVAAMGWEPTLAALRRDGLDAGLLSRAFARAHGRLALAEQAALGSLSTLCGSFSAERAAAVIGGERAAEAFHALCQASWVMRSEPAGFRLLPSVRDFASSIAHARPGDGRAAPACARGCGRGRGRLGARQFHPG